jgi:hypothetical protein
MTRSNLSEYGRVIGLPVPNLEPIIHHPPRLHTLPDMEPPPAPNPPTPEPSNHTEVIEGSDNPPEAIQPELETAQPPQLDDPEPLASPPLPSDQAPDSKLINLDDPKVLESRTRQIKKMNPKYFGADVDSISIESGPTMSEESIRAAIVAELTQMELVGAYHPVMPKDISERPIPCKMNVKLKVDSYGNPIKVKARLCAGGHRQERNPNVATSSPTASRSTVITTCIIASAQKRHVATADITGAYLEANMKSKIFMKFNDELTSIIVELFPRYVPFVFNGCITVQLDRALYGCIESALLWYKEVSSFLISIGYSQSCEDACFFFKGEGPEKTHVVVFIDDFLITSTKLSEIEDLIGHLKRKYRSVTVNIGDKHEYLGANIDFSTPHQVSICMEKKILNLVKEFRVTKSAATPAANHLFQHRDLPLLPPRLQKLMRSGLAKLLFLSINTRPDILLPVNYLSTRVDKFNADDLKKLLRIIEYLHGTANMPLILKCDSPTPIIHDYVDASYATNSENRRSQSGMIIMIGNALVTARSGGQKLVTKSSTEAELVACCDSMSYVIGLQRFLREIELPASSTIIHQDNQSTLHLINSNMPTSQRTRHIDTRYFFIREQAQGPDMTFQHTPTKDMIADLLTKPLQGSRFKQLRNILMNA